MAFKLFIAYIAMVFLRPIDQIAPDLMALRPMSLLWMAAFVSAIASWSKTKYIAAPPVQIKLLGALWLAIILSLLANGFFGDAVLAIGDFSTPAMLFILTVLNVTSIEKIEITCKTLVWCIVLLCLEGIYSYHTGFLFDKFVIRQVAREDIEVSSSIYLPADDVEGIYLWRLRSIGFLSDPNDFCQAICMATPWLFIWYNRNGYIKNLLTVIVPVSVMAYAATLTHSRGGMIGLAVLVFVQVIRRIGLMWGMMLGGIAGVAFTVLAQVGGRGFSGKEASANERLDAWYEGLEMFKHSPLFGVGYGHFEDHHIRTAHNSFVLCFAELGTFGYICWLGMIVVAFKSVIAATHSSAPLKMTLGWAMTSSLAAFLACSWFLSRSYQPSLFMLLGLCCATGMAASNNSSLKVGQLSDASSYKWINPTIVLYCISLIGVSLFVRSAK